MANSHVQPSMMAETQSIVGDLLAPVILASTLTTPGSGLTLPAFSTTAYVRQGTPTRLVYVNQPAATVTLTGAAGTYWLAIHADTHSAVAGWTRRAGSHYLWQGPTATQPADPPGGLVLASVTVTGTNISGVDTSLNYPNGKVAYGSGGGQLAFDKNLTWNGGTLKVVGGVEADGMRVLDHAGDGQIAYYSTLNTAGGTNRWFMYAGGTAPSYLGGPLTVAGATSLSSTLNVAGTTTLGTLQVNGLMGLGGVPVSGYWLSIYGSSQLGSNVSIGMLGTPATTTLDVNGSVRSRGAFTGDSTGYIGGALTCNTTIYANGQIQGSNFVTGGALYVGSTATFDGVVNMGSAAGHKLNVGGNIYVTNSVGIGRGPEGGWSLTTNGGILSYGGVQCNSSLNVYGHTILATAGTTGNLTCAQTFGTQYIQTGLETGLMRAPVAGWALSVGGAIQSNNTIANKLGAGPWGESSSRDLKRHIEDIPDALALLLTQRGRRYEWDEPEHAALLPGPQHGFVYDEVTIPQWRDVGPGGEEILTLRGSEALFVEALRTIVERVEALERIIQALARQ